MEDTGTTWVEWVAALGTIATVVTGLVVAAVTLWRRPKLSLHEGREHWHVEASGDHEPLPYIRLLARNAGFRRASHGTRVLVEHYQQAGRQKTYLGSPPLGWTSAADQGDDVSVVLFPDGERSVDLGLFQSYLSEGGDEWRFTIAPYFQIHEGRGNLRAERNGYTIRVVIGSNDGRAHRYDVHLNWNPEKRLIDNQWNSRELLDSVQVKLMDV